jgi:hypothetical protein
MSPGFFVLRLPPGVLVRDPQTGRIVTDREELPRNSFWQRLLADGQVEEETAAAPVEQNDKDKELTQ